MSVKGPDVGPQMGSKTDVTARRPWVTPKVEEMPRLTELTLQTGILGGGGTGGGGSTVF